MCQAPWDRSTEPDRVWTTEQLGPFLISARSHRLYAFYRLAAYTGARRGELLYSTLYVESSDATQVAQLLTAHS